MGRAMRLPAVPANALVNITYDMVLDYCKGLVDVVCSFYEQVEATTLPPIHDPGHNLRTADWVVVQKHKVACPLDLEEEELLRVPIPAKQVSGLEREQRETETRSELDEDGSVTSVKDEGVDLQEGEGERISIEAVGEPSQRRAFPEADNLERQTEQFPDPEGKGVEVDQSHCDLTPPETIAGPSREHTAEQGEGSSSTLRRTLTKGLLKGDKWPESQVEKIKEVVVEATIEEELDKTRREDLSKGELNADQKFQRKRIASQSCAGPKWAYATTSE
ncbi:hypothetical protein NDU88_001192 [Pleurodeles waltl]|uniref:Uncharacterized protein n=1 Tax=Pleurodeles waltl TaxID=8319 RepID=A0AAV7SZK2_PLEWA|nr:hypothetical protein NDU88_001192 [Pleurodeles waltl]